MKGNFSKLERFARRVESYCMSTLFKVKFKRIREASFRVANFLGSPFGSLVFYGTHFVAVYVLLKGTILYAVTVFFLVAPHSRKAEIARFLIRHLVVDKENSLDIRAVAVDREVFDGHGVHSGCGNIYGVDSFARIGSYERIFAESLVKSHGYGSGRKILVVVAGVYYDGIRSFGRTCVQVLILGISRRDHKIRHFIKGVERSCNAVVIRCKTGIGSIKTIAVGKSRNSEDNLHEHTKDKHYCRKSALVGCNFHFADFLLPDRELPVDF